jgi:hypothetical protein
MSKLVFRIVLGVLLAALVFIGSSASVAVADCADPNTVLPTTAE